MACINSVTIILIILEILRRICKEWIAKALILETWKLSQWRASTPSRVYLVGLWTSRNSLCYVSNASRQF